ncbi:AP-3 complex subunit beta-2 [Taenia crassiceps]|uniref:AP-3 complex subunit beta-2 n=1 Tax=Taenia crassiceps TaxID=6207 RepID=A0ABR4Q8F6_9CEST
MQTSELLAESNGFQTPGIQSLSSDFEVGLDPASNMIFCSDYQKNEDIKKMLDSNKENLKLTAMRRVVAMVARGKECSDLFPAVVKNVVSKDAEVRKLVYVYLTRYAEEQQDLALLSVSTFQRSLKDVNQLVRASALRVLSSIRIPVIAPIVMLAVRDGAVDLSSYVRRAVAHAIPKLYSLDPDAKESLVEIINKLLADRSTVVVGGAVQAFEEVCPERLDLIHKHYRKLCNLLMDVDEWGQIAIINMLTRYARTQFPNPKTCLSTANVGVSGGDAASNTFRSRSAPLGEDRACAVSLEDEDDEDDDDASESGNEGSKEKRAEGSMDPAMENMIRSDYNLLITVSRFLLLSHNAAVVVAVAQLFYHCAPKEEMGSVVKALMRILRSTKEIEQVVLSNIASLSLLHPNLFEPYLRMFFVFNNDPIQVKLLKLEILTNLVNTSTSSIILREFQAYVDSSDEGFVLATVQCIGRCASMVPQIAETCLTGLLRLISRKNENLVAESVVVMRKLLQMQTTDHKDVIAHIAQMVEEITVPSARASILWLLGEYGHRVPKIAPDVLRKMAKSFPKEHVAVKLQILNLAAKLSIVNAQQTLLIAQYVFTLAKYDQNYDVRDRSRIFRALIFPKPTDPAKPELSYLTRNVKKILLATKPAPVLRSTFADRPTFRLGSMSQLLGRELAKYKELPEWPLVPPDPTTRCVTVAPPQSHTGASSDHSGRSLSISQQETEDEDSIEQDNEAEENENEGVSESDEEEAEDDENEEGENDYEIEKIRLGSDSLLTESNSESDAGPLNKTESYESISTESSLESDEEKGNTGAIQKTKDESSPVLLLDFDSPLMSTMGNAQDSFPSLEHPLVPIVVSSPRTCPPTEPTLPNEAAIELSIPPYELSLPEWFFVTSAYAEPLLVEARFVRTVSVFGPRQTNLELRLTNRSIAPQHRLYRLRPDTSDVATVASSSSRLAGSLARIVQPFTEVEALELGASTNVFIGVDFCNSTQPLRFGLRYQLNLEEEEQVRNADKKQTPDQLLNLEIKPPVGELFQPLNINVQEFVSKQTTLRGMHDTTKSFSCAMADVNLVRLAKRLLHRANLGLIGAFSKTTVDDAGADLFATTDASTTATRILRLAGVTAGGGENEATCCLVELVRLQPLVRSMNLFLRKSQIFAAAGLVGGVITSCLMQPYLEVFVRWHHVETEHGQEVKPTDRINRIANSVFAKLHVPEAIRSKVDFFLTKNGEAVALGILSDEHSKNSNDYAFIGLPYFCTYEDPYDIPLEGMNFASPLFPYTAYSSQGMHRLQLMCLSDSALEFLIAREVASLLGSRKLKEYGTSGVKSTSPFLPPRLASRVACLSLVVSLYLAYQVCYVLNRLCLYNTCSRPFRLLGYTGITVLMLLCQRQIIVSWRHNASLALDTAVARANHDLLVGGIEYYDWKRSWNAFWMQILPSSRRAMKVLRDVQRGLKDPTILHRNPTDYYFIPMSIDQLDNGSQRSSLRLDDCSPSYLSAYHLPGYDANSLQGDEKFASDGETLLFNMAGLLAFGALPVWLASVFEMFSFPVTCTKRKAALEALL